MHRFPHAAVAALVVLASLGVVAVAPAASATFSVGFDGAFPQEAVERLGGRVASVDDALGFATVTGPPGLADALRGLAAVSFVEEQRPVRSSAVAWDAGRWDSARWDSARWDASRWDSARWDASRWDASRWDASRWDASRMDSGFGIQWNLAALGVDEAWEKTTAYHARTICVVDSGIDATHPDLRNNVLRRADGTFGYDFVNGDNDPSDDGGHGTHVAGIAAAEMGNGQGIAGVSQAWVIAAKVLDANGDGTDDNLARGIRYCADARAHIILLALHADAPTTVVQQALNYALGKGLVIIAAAGNKGQGVAFPASHPGVIAVGASRSDATPASFSNRGTGLTLLAPGEEIPGPVPGGYAFASGTSQAAANMAGVAALVWAADPNATADKVRERLIEGTEELKMEGDDRAKEDFGRGHSRADKAVD